MIADGMCTRAQLEDGMEKLHSLVQDYYKRQGEESGVVDLAMPVKTSQWSIPVPVKGQDKSPSQLATAEIDEFIEKMKFGTYRKCLDTERWVLRMRMVSQRSLCTSWGLLRKGVTISSKRNGKVVNGQG